MPRTKKDQAIPGNAEPFEGADGRWHAYVYMGVKDDGSIDRRHRSGKTKRAVLAKIKQLEGRRDSGIIEAVGSDASTITVSDWMRLWITVIAPRTINENTLISTYEPKVRLWIVPLLGKHRLQRLQPEHVEAAYVKLELEHKLAPNTVLQIHRILRRALQAAVQRHKVARNVCDLIDPPEAEASGGEPYTEDEVRRILVAARSRRNGSRWGVALALGPRQAEALGLRKQYIDLDETGTLDFSWQLKWRRNRHGCDDPAQCGTDTGQHRDGCRRLCVGHARRCPQRIPGRWEFVKPKGKVRKQTGRRPGERVLTAHKVLRAWIKADLAAQAAEKLAAGELWEDWDLVWCTPLGKPIQTRDDWEDWCALCLEAGVEVRRPHDARHTSGSLMVGAGVDIRIVQKILGHAQLATTQRYTDPADPAVAAANTKLGDALWR